MNKNTITDKVWGVLRIMMGWIFLWAFIDKLFGLGFATSTEEAWLTGASPTAGFLSFATKGPFAELFQALSGSQLVDWLFMLGLLGIGVSLLLGVFVRIGSIAGIIMLVLMYLAALLPEHNPLIDDHIVYAVIMIGLIYSNSGNCLGLGKCWENTSLVRKFPVLK